MSRQVAAPAPKLTGSRVYKPWNKHVFARTDFKCAYCDRSMKALRDWWLLTVHHLLPRDHPRRREYEFIVTCCIGCSSLDNRAFERLLRENKEHFRNPSRAALLRDKRNLLERKREAFERRHIANVKSRTKQGFSAIQCRCRVCRDS